MSWTIHTVTGETGDLLAGVRVLWTAYWDSFGLPAEFQGFAEELRTLPGKYAAPAGRLLLARDAGGRPAATAAFRPLRAPAVSCEAKRLYVAPAYRRQGLAKIMLARLADEARASGYAWMYGDTLPAMASALRLYAEVGFEEVGPYSDHPTPGAVYLRLML